MLDEVENATLIKKLEHRSGVMDSTKEILDEAMNHGMKLAIISNYGKAAVPVLKNDAYQSDFLIDTGEDLARRNLLPISERRSPRAIPSALPTVTTIFPATMPLTHRPAYIPNTHGLSKI